MTEKYIILIVCLFFTACENSNTTENKIEMNEPTEIILNFNDFVSQQFLDWNDMMEEWRHDDFQKSCLDQNNFVQDCVDCADIIVVVTFRVDNDGRISSLTEVEDAIDCPQRSPEELLGLKKNLMNSFSKLRIPESLRNRILNVPIGQSTLC